MLIIFHSNLKGYALCRRPPLSGRGFCGSGCAVLAVFLVCSFFVFLSNVRRQVALLAIRFRVFSLIAVTSDSDIILGTKTYYLAGLALCTLEAIFAAW